MSSMRSLLRESDLSAALLSLIELCAASGLDGHADVHYAKGLIRCDITGCGLAGACDGRGSEQYPCPLAAWRRS